LVRRFTATQDYRERGRERSLIDFAGAQTIKQISGIRALSIQAISDQTRIPAEAPKVTKTRNIEYLTDIRQH